MTEAQLFNEFKKFVASKGALAQKPKASKADLLAAKDKAIVRGFAKKGIKDVVLMDRNDLTKPFNVRPYGEWFKRGYQVRKGETSVRGMFHITQTDEITPAE